MKKVVNLVCQSLCAALVALPCAAQDAWSFGMNMGGGPTSGGLKVLSQDAGFTFGLNFEAVKPLSKDAAIVASLGYQWLPGDNKLVSYIPLSVPATVDNQRYESRDRKVDTGGFQFGVAYRGELAVDGMFWQAGLRLTFLDAREKDGGSGIITNGTAIANTGTATAPAIKSVYTIASDRRAKAVSLGPVVGVGYRFNDTQAVTFNVSRMTAEAPTAGRQSGLAAELGFNLRF